MITTSITWVTYLAAILLMFAGCFRLHRKVRSMGSLLLQFTLPFYVFVHNLALFALEFFMTHRQPPWVNNWVMWGVSDYMPLFVMLLASIGVFAVARSIQWPMS